MSAQRVRPRLTFLSAIAAEPGVEPELYTSTPRRVTNTRKMHRWRRWGANLIAGLLSILYYCWHMTGVGREPMSVIIYASVVLIVAAWLGAEGMAYGSHKFLRDGYAVRATVEKCEPSEMKIGYVDVQYHYTGMDGKQATGYLRVTYDVAKRVGGLGRGTTFTVLLHPTERYDLLPYFQAYGVEIPGAAPVRTTPP